MKDDERIKLDLCHQFDLYVRHVKVILEKTCPLYREARVKARRIHNQEERVQELEAKVLTLRVVRESHYLSKGLNIAHEGDYSLKSVGQFHAQDFSERKVPSQRI